jgi:hypothetical protein
MMSSEEMQNYLNADNKLQQYTPSHLINVFGMNGNSNHVLNLDTEELHEGQVQPRKNWLL